jgi:filamentous hemagglutinin family protein
MRCGKNAVVVAGYRTQRAPGVRGRARWILGWAASVTVAGIAPALALARTNHVDVKNVAAGSARFSERGNVMTVRAADRTVINYRRFDIDPGGTVRFVQPSRDSRVLNRIDAVAPSRIDGKLLANGSVYFVNPAGVTFGPNAIVNVGKIYAAAGNISDSDFLGGVDRFTVSG